MLKNLFSKISGDPNEKAVARLRPIVAEINSLEDEFRRLSADDLLAVTAEFRQQLAEALAEPREAIESAEAELENEEDADRRRQLEQEIKQLETDLFKVEDEELDQILPRAFAAVRESAQRTIGQRHFDVQLIGGVVLHQGKIAEMKTGEGKTLVATLPLYLHALSGRGCHLITVNDYLARRDGGWMGAIFQQLGLKVGLITGDFSGLYDPDYVDPQGHLEDERLVHWRPSTRQEAYLADITYGTSSEFGFDYLRDNLSAELSHCVQREFYYAIVDEVDNILIDESRTPLIISGPAEEAADDYTRFAELVRPLRRNTAAEDAEPNGDFNIEERTRAITLTERGIARVEAELLKLGVLREGESVYDPQYYALTSYLDNALRAQHVYRRDKEYVVMEGRVVIV
ncbi:MAG TPA: preprotein translocase subunit SecA, partial [Anaerolineae bacterium]